MDLPSVELDEAACTALPESRANEVAQARLKTRSLEPGVLEEKEKNDMTVWMTKSRFADYWASRLWVS